MSTQKVIPAATPQYLPKYVSTTECMDTAAAGLSSQTRIVGSTKTSADPRSRPYETSRKARAGKKPPAAQKYGSARLPPPTAVPVMISAASHSSALEPCATSSPLASISRFSKNSSLSTHERVGGRLGSRSSKLRACEGGTRNSLPPTISGTGASGSAGTMSAPVSIVRSERRSAPGISPDAREPTAWLASWATDDSVEAEVVVEPLID